MKNTCPFYIIFQVLKVLFIKIWKIEPPDLLFIVVVIVQKVKVSVAILTDLNLLPYQTAIIQ